MVTMLVPGAPAWTDAVLMAGMGAWFTIESYRKQGRDIALALSPVEPVELVDDSMVRDWCQGCGNVPIRRLMGWSEAGLYRCRSCRADGPTETPVLDLMASTADCHDPVITNR